MNTLRKHLIQSTDCNCQWKIGCTLCDETACCKTGVRCENPDHPIRYYGNSTVEEWFCPECSYVVENRSVWCKKCVENQEF